MNTHSADNSASAASDGLDMQQRAMGVAGQLAALLDQPYLGDAQQVAMGSASQSLLAAAAREVGSYVSTAGADAASARPGSYVSAQADQPIVANSYVNTPAPSVVGAYVTSPVSVR